MDLITAIGKELQTIASSPLSFTIAVLASALVVWRILEWAYRTTIQKKDATIQMLQEQQKMGRDQDADLRQARSHRRGLSEIELEAVALREGRPSVYEAFLDLTDKGILHLRWNPFDEPVGWEASVPPTEKEVERIAALRLFMDRGYISSVIDNGLADYSVLASDKAMAVRETCNLFSQGDGNE